MKKLVQGIVDFRKKLLPEDRKKFAKLALGQTPDALFVCCSDSRVAPNVFASTEPGDLFVIRNPGNFFPPCGIHGLSVGDQSEVAALEYALLNLQVDDIIICGHSECGAMKSLFHGTKTSNAPHVDAWLAHGQPALELLKEKAGGDCNLSSENLLSQLNVLQQVKHIHTYPLVKSQVSAKKLSVHAWWFDIGKADVYTYNESLDRFVIIDDTSADSILNKSSSFDIS